MPEQNARKMSLLDLPNFNDFTLTSHKKTKLSIYPRQPA